MLIMVIHRVDCIPSETVRTHRAQRDTAVGDDDACVWTMMDERFQDIPLTPR